MVSSRRFGVPIEIVIIMLAFSTVLFFFCVVVFTVYVVSYSLNFSTSFVSYNKPRSQSLGAGI